MNYNDRYYDETIAFACSKDQIKNKFQKIKFKSYFGIFDSFTFYHFVTTTVTIVPFFLSMRKSLEKCLQITYINTQLAT